MTEPAKLPLIDDGAPVIFADAGSSIMMMNGNLHITFEVAKQQWLAEVPDGPTQAVFERHVVARVVIPLAAAEQIAQMIVGFAQNARSQAAHMPPPGTPITLN